MLFTVTAYYGQAFRFCIKMSANSLEEASDEANLMFKRATLLIVEVV